MIDPPGCKPTEESCRHARLGRALVLALAFFTFPVIAPVGASEEELRQNLIDLFRSRSESIRSFSVEFSETVERHDWQSDPSFRGTPVYSMHTRYAEQDGKFMRIVEALHNPDDDTLRTGMNFWDGILYKWHSPLTSRGRVAGEPPSIRYSSATPIERAMISVPKGSEPGLDKLLLDPSVTVTTEPDGLVRIDLTRSALRSFWLDPAKNYLMVRSKSYFSPQRSNVPLPPEGLLKYETEVVAQKEVSPGLWIPIKWSRTKYIGPPADKSLWGQIAVISTTEVSKVDINPDLPLEIFQFTFPRGTIVENKIIGEIEKVGFTYTRELRALIEQPLEPEAPEEIASPTPDQQRLFDSTTASDAQGSGSLDVDEGENRTAGMILAALVALAVILLISFVLRHGFGK